MKTFAFPITIEGTREQLTAAQRFLSNLGYQMSTTASHQSYADDRTRLCTNVGDQANRMGYMREGDRNSLRRTIIDARNTNLWRELAAACTNPTWQAGEVFVNARGTFERVLGIVNSPVATNFRRPTIHEIIARYPNDNVDWINPVLHGIYAPAQPIQEVAQAPVVEQAAAVPQAVAPQQETIGYRLNPIFLEAARLLLGRDSIVADAEGHVVTNPVTIEQATGLNLLDTWFTPIVRDIPIPEVINMPTTGVNARVGRNIFEIDDLAISVVELRTALARYDQLNA